MSDKIFPRNLTARAAAIITGNPASTRLESGVGNCFPGLEFDHRNLDRRFFPGLIFNFGAPAPLLEAVDPLDPALADQTQPEAADMSREVRAAFDKLGKGVWSLTSISQRGRRIDVDALQDVPASLWRVVRSLVHDQVTIVLTKSTDASSRAPDDARAAKRAPRPETVTLTHLRRSYVNPDSGVISEAYLPGELTQSLCSPWMHDFRDCGCNYWASNHPDIVLGADDRISTGDLADADPGLVTRPLDWLRADRASIVAAAPSAGANRVAQLRHHQINSEWTTLAFVLERRENFGIYSPGREAPAEPFASPYDLAQKLQELCELEHAVMLEYLYAYYSLKDADEVGAAQAGDILFVRHELIGIAVSEMRHLRWANQLLWSLRQTGMLEPSPPVLAPAGQVPGANGERPIALRVLAWDVLNDFIAVERPSGTLDGAYARVVATLATGYPAGMLQLARQIVADGLMHYNRFREIEVILKQWPSAGSADTPWLRLVRKGSADETTAALAAYRAILDALGAAYRNGDMEDGAYIVTARESMMRLNEEAETLARAGIGIPFI